MNTNVSIKRNLGVAYSTGDYLVFLDADDYLFSSGISLNLYFFSQHPASAFVSGGFDRVDENGNFLQSGATTETSGDNYVSLLRGNYIGMEGNVMYKRAVFSSFHFSVDPAVQGSEDYFLHLQICRFFPAYGHTEKITAYRIHRTNMSNDRKRMLKSTLYALRQQKKLLFCKKERKAYRQGIKIWQDYYHNNQ